MRDKKKMIISPDNARFNEMTAGFDEESEA